MGGIDKIKRFIDRKSFHFRKFYRKKKYDTIVLLGRCEISHSRDLGLRQESLPLDFAVSYKNKEISDLIKGKFKNLTSTGTPAINNYDNLNKESVKSKDFNIFFPHHSQNEIKNKFNKRIERFYEILESDKRVLFIRKNHFDIPITKEDSLPIKERSWR